MDNISEKNCNRSRDKMDSMFPKYDREDCTRYQRCPYCPAAYKQAAVLSGHLSLHFQGLRKHRMYDFLEKESNMVFRCRYQCKEDLSSTMTNTDGRINKENRFWNEVHKATEHYYGEDQLVPTGNRIDSRRCPFRCSKLCERIVARYIHEKWSHRLDTRVFADDNSSSSQRCKERCRCQQGHVGHPKTDLDIFQVNAWNQCRKQCLGFPPHSDSDSASIDALSETMTVDCNNFRSRT